MDGSKQYAYRWPIGFVAGDDFAAAFTFTNADGTPYVISSATVKFWEVKSGADVGPALAPALTLAGNVVGINWTDAQSILLPTGPERYGYTITLVTAGNVRATLSGPVSVLDRRSAAGVSSFSGTFTIPTASNVSITVVSGGVALSDIMSAIANAIATQAALDSSNFLHANNNLSDLTDPFAALAHLGTTKVTVTDPGAVAGMQTLRFDFTDPATPILIYENGQP